MMAAADGAILRRQRRRKHWEAKGRRGVVPCAEHTPEEPPGGRFGYAAIAPGPLVLTAPDHQQTVIYAERVTMIRLR